MPPTTAAAARSVDRGPQSAICAGISALVRERWGRGPSRSRAYFAGPDTLVVLLNDMHTEAERTLIEHGRGAEVLSGRRALAELTDEALRQIGRCVTGRRVRGLHSQTSLDPAVTTHVFLLGSETGATADGELLGDEVRRALENTRALRAEGAQARLRSAEGRARAQAAREQHEGQDVQRPPGRRDDAG